jgi:hypothetical protein
MSMMGELTFFLGIQVKQMKQGTFMHQAKYTKDLMKKFNMAELKSMSTLMSTTTSLGPLTLLYILYFSFLLHFLYTHLSHFASPVILACICLIMLITMLG